MQTLTESPQNKKSKARPLRTFLKLQPDHLNRNKGVAHQFNETAIFIATPMKKCIKQFIVPVNTVFVNLLTEKLWVLCQNIIFFLVIQTRFLIFVLVQDKGE